MTTTKFDIASQGFALLRADTVASFTSGSNESDIGSVFYDSFVQDILTRHPWTFATKKRRLNQNGESPVSEYRYAHIIPSECLRVWALFPSSNVGAAPINDYDLQQVDGSRIIYSNYENIYADYTVYVDESFWPSYFVHYAIHAWAALVGHATTGDTALADRMQVLAYGTPQEQEKGGKFGVAVDIDAQQKPADQIIDSPFIAARFGGI